jgi:hypothetical protein
MAENKTKPTEVSVADYIAAIPEAPRRADAQALLNLMQAATGEEPRLWGPSIIGFGSYHYRYETGREGDTLIVGFSPRKPATVLYGLRAAPDVDSLLDKLGKHTSGKGCVYIKKLADVDQKVLAELIRKSAAATRAKH